MRNTFLKIKHAELLTSRASFQTFKKTVKNTPCEFCGLKYCSLHSVQKCDDKSQKCDKQYHEACVGTVGGKQFICGICS